LGMGWVSGLFGNWVLGMGWVDIYIPIPKTQIFSGRKLWIGHLVENRQRYKAKFNCKNFQKIAKPKKVKKNETLILNGKIFVFTTKLDFLNIHLFTHII